MAGADVALAQDAAPAVSPETKYVFNTLLFVIGGWKATQVKIGDLHAGVPELRADSQYNIDTDVITSKFAIGVDVITTTLGKALGGASGGCVSGRAELVEMCRQKARPYLFSNTVAPVIVSGAIKVMEIVERAGTRLALPTEVHYTSGQRSFEEAPEAEGHSF